MLNVGFLFWLTQRLITVPAMNAHDKPMDGGTWDIIWTCLAVVSLCCWTSICTKWSGSKDGKLDRLRDKITLALFGIIAPDFLLAVAMGQRDRCVRQPSCTSRSPRVG